MPARFHEQELKARLKNKRNISAFLDRLVLQHRPAVRKISLNYIFCTDEALLSMNQQFLNHDTLTDIITFDLSEKETDLTGEIYISIDSIEDNGRKFNTGYQQELHRVIFHGVLHLCGFKDKSRKDASIMRQQEEICLKAWEATHYE